VREESYEPKTRKCYQSDDKKNRKKS